MGEIVQGAEQIDEVHQHRVVVEYIAPKFIAQIYREERNKLTFTVPHCSRLPLDIAIL